MIVTAVPFWFRVPLIEFAPRLGTSELVLVDRVRHAQCAWQDASVMKSPTVGIRIYDCHGGALLGSCARDLVSAQAGSIRARSC